MEEKRSNIENHQVDEEEDEGPPPGFDSLAVPSQNTNVVIDEDDDEGPPPGWPSIPQQNNQNLLQTTDVEMGSKGHESEDDEDGPPPGWNTVIPQKKLPSSLPTIEAVTCDIEMEKKEEVVEDKDNGPPPRWKLTPKLPQLQTSTPPSGTQGASLEDIEMEKKEVVEDEDNGPPPGWQLTPQLPPLQTSAPPSGTQGLADVEMASKQDCDVEKEGHPLGSESIPMTGHSSPPTPPPQSSSSVASSEMEMGSKQEGTKNEEVRPQIEKQSMSHLRQMKSIVPQSSSHAATVSAEMGQMVCGGCRQLLSYPQGAKLVKCSCCQTVNLVLEAHDVGQVKCGGCAVLLMYQYGAPSVRCSSCHHMTKIGAHNRRPPLSVQQLRRRHPSYQVH
ncbi:uncharacterized protein LOC129872318 isoform X2 [Solanum dulcamara]|uniref:uncharacterized protein LOC129872318 isoform X2 n=1 Tax=Solanum dulcamara TaxID=45834 RepID=UPI002484DB37|nr:uncharacterized protein LOC129872318 isoform X2 [Solanum dulcamara]